MVNSQFSDDAVGCHDGKNFGLLRYRRFIGHPAELSDSYPPKHNQKYSAKSLEYGFVGAFFLFFAPNIGPSLIERRKNTPRRRVPRLKDLGFTKEQVANLTAKNPRLLSSLVFAERFFLNDFGPYRPYLFVFFVFFVFF